MVLLEVNKTNYGCEFILIVSEASNRTEIPLAR
jgi:hypothetical protein